MPSIPSSYFGPPRLGKFILARQEKVAKMWRHADEPCKDSKHLHFVVSDNSQDAVYILGRDKLPGDVTIWFALAGEHGLFENDLSRFCHTVIFCSHLKVKGEDGERWINGFNVSPLEQFDRREVRALLGDRLFRHAARIMFVNLYGPPPNNSPAYASSLFLHMISVLGHLKVNALLLGGQTSVRSLSQAARNFYASAYERRAALGLRAECYRQTMNRRIADMARLMVGSIEQEWIPEVNAQMKDAYSAMPRREKRALMLDPLVSPQNISAYERFIVELV